MPLQYTNINGKLVEEQAANIPAGNRAFRYGYGLFETILYIDGRLQLATYHWQRLFEGMQQLQFDIPAFFTPGMLENEVHKTVEKNKLQKLCRVRLQVYPGNGGLYDTNSRQPVYIIECFQLEPHITALNENGLILGIYHHAKKSNDAIAHLKSCNALIYALAAREAKKQKWNDSLIYNTGGNIIESTIANIFWVKDNRLYTPPLSEGCVAGVMRRHIMHHFDVVETPLSTSLLSTADEVFLTNAIRRLKWVSAVGSHSYTRDYTASVQKSLFP